MSLQACSTSVDLTYLTTALKTAQQEHVLKFHKELGKKSKTKLVQYLSTLNISDINTMYEEAVQYSNSIKNNRVIEPLTPNDYFSKATTTAELLNVYMNQGLTAIGKNEVCVILIDNENTPPDLNGKFRPGLPSDKSLFQLQAQKILRLQQLATEHTGIKNCVLTWYIMGDSESIDDYLEFFRANNYFGLDHANVLFFEQNSLPSFDFNGKLLLRTKSTLVQTPDGSGGLFHALKNGVLLNDMHKRNINYILTYSTENLLVKIADPMYIGHCITRNVDCGAKMVMKEHANEPLGTFCLIKGRILVISSTEINPEVLYMKKDKQSLTFCAGDVANYFFTIQFLENVINSLLNQLDLHAVKAKVDCISYKGKQENTVLTNGIVLKRYIYDVFRHSQNFTIWEIPRLSEYYALKHTDNPKKYQKSKPLDQYYQLNTFYIEKAGGFIMGKEIEISPLITYDGEGLDKICKGTRFQAPLVLLSDEEHAKLNATLSREKKRPKKMEKKKSETKMEKKKSETKIEKKSDIKSDKKTEKKPVKRSKTAVVSKESRGSKDSGKRNSKGSTRANGRDSSSSTK